MSSNLSINSFQIKKTLGNGSTGEVLLCTKNNSKRQYVLKKIQMEILPEKLLTLASSEYSILKSINHPNIIKAFSSFEEGNNLYIVQEYADKGDLAKFISVQKTPLSEDLILQIFIQMAMALDFVHSQGIIHRDIKPANIFRFSSKLVKIGDFGISKVVEDVTKTIVGTPLYLAPEVFLGNSYNFKADSWSLGCVLYELCTFKPPFYANNISELLPRVTKGTFQEINGSNQMKSLIRRMIEPDPVKRLDVREILQLPFIRSKLRSHLLFIEKCLVTKKSRTFNNFQKRQIVQIQLDKSLPILFDEIPLVEDDFETACPLALLKTQIRDICSKKMNVFVVSSEEENPEINEERISMIRKRLVGDLGQKTIDPLIDEMRNGKLDSVVEFVQKLKPKYKNTFEELIQEFHPNFVF